jgi:DNA-directed RNA polymerase sigma subunit (sigma70/sigma32)
MAKKRASDFNMTLEEIAEQLGLEKYDVRIILDSAMRKMRRTARKMGLEDHLDSVVFHSEQR